jgi:type IV secretory pathway ATPase VirB11/archaellum biosynthesis ATPase
VIRAVGNPDRRLARLRARQIVLGGTGTGKTTQVPPITTLLPRL